MHNAILICAVSVHAKHLFVWHGSCDIVAVQYNDMAVLTSWLTHILHHYSVTQLQIRGGFPLTFFLFLHENMLWVLMRSASLRQLLMSTHNMFSWRNKKNTDFSVVKSAVSGVCVHLKVPKCD